MLSTKNNFYLYSQSLTPDSNGYIRIPYRAIGNSVAEIRDTTSENLIGGYSFENAYIRFYPVITQTCKVYYFLRPGKLTTDYAQITAVNTVGGATVATVSSVPSAFTTSLQYDVTRKNPGFELLVMDADITSIVGSDITFTSDITSSMQAGDIITISDQAFVPNIPLELFPLLAHMASVQVLQSLGDIEAATFLARQTEGLKKSALSMITPRSQNRSKVIKKSNYYRW